MADLTPELADVLPRWLAGRRWYAGKGRLPRLRRLATLRWQDPSGEVDLLTHLLEDTSGSAPVVYQVPLTYRRAPMDSLHTALVAATEDGTAGTTRYVYDAAADPAYIQALLDLVHGSASVSGEDHSGAPAAAHGHVAGQPGDRPVVRHCALLSGEQSNTSVIIETEAGGPLIVKLFRVLQDGPNPDVAVQTALAASGSALVPQPFGHVSATWPGPAGHAASGDLAFVQEFLPGVQDAWRTALEAAQADQDFTEQARSLGGATARMHRSLREAFGTTPVTDDTARELLDRCRERADEALACAPDLEPLRGSVDGVFAAAAAEAASWPPLQRVHGDYHLGQVLDVPDRGWVVLDFEGEPLRALEQRTAPDLALRDVAGMLRSFDYAAGTMSQDHGLDRGTWAARTRQAFLDGYAEVEGVSPWESAALLAALELDKALYEVVYEARNRPAWIAIPVAAVRRLLDSDAAASGEAGMPPAPAGDPAYRRQPQPLPLSSADVARLLRGRSTDPHGVLGAHPHDGGVTVRVLRPLATSVTLLLPGEERVPMWHETEGVWTAVLDRPDVPDYRVEVTWADGVAHRQDDPYRFLPTLGEVDLHLIGEGRHEQLWAVLGAHTRSYDGPMGPVHGTSFAVWAPHALGVHVVGDFNQWDNTAHPMRSLGGAGVWELFVPGAGAGSRYKYDITGPDGHRRLKADPMARAAEVPPSSASIVHHSTHEWQDQEWMAARATSDPHTGPMSIYEVHLGSWRFGKSYRELADELVDYVSQMGFTHVEFLPVMQHPYGPSWGYHVTGYYAADSRLGSPDDLKYLIDRMHQAGIGVLLDWVPGHFATDPWALARFDGTPIYEHPDPRRGWHNEWGSFIFDFGRPQVRNFLVANAVYWLQEFHADGLRVDGVASMLYLDYSREPGQWLPNKHGGRENLEAVHLLQEANATAYRRIPGIVMVAEESTSWPGVTRPTSSGGLGFGFKWNMGWMHDSLDYVALPPIHRQYHHHRMTFSLMYAFSEQFVLPISHDEVVHGKGSLLRKMSGDRWQQLANLRAYLAFMWSHPGKQLLFMGQEFAQESEWAESRSLDWWVLDQPAHLGVQHLVRDLNAAYRRTPALWELDSDPGGFAWLDADDAGGNTYSFVRYGSPDQDGTRPTLVAIANFSGTPRSRVRVGLPRGGRWLEVLNTDAASYGGSGVGNLGAVEAVDEPHLGQPHFAEVTLPPLGVVWLAPDANWSPPEKTEPVAEAVAGTPATPAAGTAPLPDRSARTSRPATSTGEAEEAGAD